MKVRRISSLVLLLILLFPVVSSAESELTISQKSLYIIDNYGYFFAKVENNSQEPLAYDTGKLVVFDKGDNIVETTDYIWPNSYNCILNPGEYVYVREWILFDSSNIELGDYKFSVSEENRGTEYLFIPCEATIDIPGSDTYDNNIIVTITNNTEEEQTGLRLTAAITDENGVLLVVAQSTYDNITLHPGSTITVEMSIDNDNIKCLERDNLVPTNVDAYVCIEK